MYHNSMKKTHRLIYAIFILSFVLTSAYTSGSDSPVQNQIVIILDASGSMWGLINGETKIKIAREALLEIVEGLSGKPVNIALRIYGHQNKKCSNTVLEIPMGPVDLVKIRKKVMPLKPKGKTPISLSLIKSVDDFDKNFSGEKVVILITDGIETCKGNPCQVAETLNKGGVITKIHLVGFAMQADELSALKCVVQPSGGIIVRADSREELKKALTDLVEDAVEKNLIVSARDRSGRGVFIKVSIFQDSLEVTHSEGNDVGFYLKPGKYTIEVMDAATNEKRSLQDIELNGDNLQRYSVTFGIADLIIHAMDTSGKTLESILVIYDAGTSKIKYILERNKIHRQELEKGVYDIEIQDIETNEKQWLGGLVFGNENVEKNFIFKRGVLKIITKNHKGLDIKTNVDIYKKGDKVPIKSSPGKSEHEFILPEGTFNISVKYWYSQAGASLEGVEIFDGNIIEKEIIVNTE